MFEVRHVCGLVSLSDKEMGYQAGGRLTQNMVTGCLSLIRVVYTRSATHWRTGAASWANEHTII